MTCPTCGKDTIMGLPQCPNCWEVEKRIDKYLESKEGLHMILNKISVIKLTEELERQGLKLDGTD
jgi:predicted DsbA family dithiol-disulfide isomerase